MRTLRVDQFILKYQFIFWALGLYVLSFYFVFALSTKRIVRHFQKKDIFFGFLVLFFLLQFFSSLISPLGSYYSFSRFLVIFHNILVFGGLIIGYVSFGSESMGQFIMKKGKSWFYLMAILCVSVFIYFFVFKSVIQYPGIITVVTGIENSFTIVEFNAIGNFFGLPFPRSQILGLFSNTTSILLFIFYAIFLLNNENNYSGMKMFFSAALLLIAVITTGSRIAIVLATLFIPFSFVKSTKELVIITLSGLALFFVVYQLDIVNVILESRGSSNNLRFKLYEVSVQMFLQDNPFTGLGLKPRPEIFYGEFPVGSHSTMLGYFVKSGILAGACYLIFHLYLFVNLGVNFIKGLQGRLKDFAKFKFQIIVNFVFILFLFDDMDSYEPIGFYTGYLIACFRAL